MTAEESCLVRTVCLQGILMLSSPPLQVDKMHMWSKLFFFPLQLRFTLSRLHAASWMQVAFKELFVNQRTVQPWIAEGWAS